MSASGKRKDDARDGERRMDRERATNRTAPGWGLCGYCAGIYAPGDPIRHDDGGTVHDRCWRKQRATLGRVPDGAIVCVPAPSGMP